MTRVVGAFIQSSQRTAVRRAISSIQAGKEWSIADDWDSLSSENARMQGSDLFNKDLTQRAAWQMESKAPAEQTEEDLWLEKQIEMILQEDTTNNVNQDGIDIDSFTEDMGTEISMLIRCNDSPERLLIEQGRALPTLTDQERENVAQLVNEKDYQPTSFFKQAVRALFYEHAVSQNGVKVLDPSGVAAWLTKSLDSTKPVGPHDPRVNSIISRYSSYSSGHLTEKDFLKVYLEAVVGPFEPVSLQRLAKDRATEITSVWRDLRNHGILSPIEVEREMLAQKLKLKDDGTVAANLMDECEIVDDEHLMPSSRRETTSSHQLVDLADDGKTPLWVKDGEFVFIDEESCIGCTQCVLAAPASFHMTDYDGRARTFAQRSSPDVAAAVASCPVDCMHYVSFRELKELETARDHGDGRDDHRHFGQSPTRGYIAKTPLHVSGRDSDANHRSSWYHYLRNKCYSSSKCPQAGCFDCPLYRSDPYSNPYFQQRQKEATHARATHFINHGLADQYRKTADL